jgi:hypothetical protein
LGGHEIVVATPGGVVATFEAAVDLERVLGAMLRRLFEAKTMAHRKEASRQAEKGPVPAEGRARETLRHA